MFLCGHYYSCAHPRERYDNHLPFKPARSVIEMNILSSISSNMCSKSCYDRETESSSRVIYFTSEPNSLSIKKRTMKYDAAPALTSRINRPRAPVCAGVTIPNRRTITVIATVAINGEDMFSTYSRIVRPNSLRLSDSK